MVAKTDGDPANSGLRREPGLERHKDITPNLLKPPVNEFELNCEEADDTARFRLVARNTRLVARQASMDPNDGIEL